LVKPVTKISAVPSGSILCARTSWAEGMHAPNGEGTPLHETDLVGNFRRLVAGEITRSACGPVVMQRDRLVVS
jgi:hypothetical protein